jgi:hypothetical protein
MPEYTNYAGELAHKLDEYRVRGQREAAEHRPPGDSTRMDQYESSLQSEAEKWMATEQRLFEGAAMEASRALAEGTQKAVELQNTVNQLLHDSSMSSAVQTDLAGERNQLVSATEARMRAEVDWRHLRAKNNISDEASYPDSIIMHVAIILGLALFETFLNAFFYENEQGLLGGFFVALGVAVMNMAGALVLGYLFRYTNLRNSEHRVLGWLSAVAFVVLTIYCNALFSTFRSEFQILVDASDPMQVRQAFATAASEARKVFILDMRIADLSSFVLFGLGILLSGFAFYKGYTLDDKYPGHGKLDRKVRALRKKEIELQELLRQKVKDVLHGRRADVQVALNEPGLIIALAGRRAGELGNAATMLQTQATTIQREFAMVLTTYRSANTSVRAADPPTYFQVIPDLQVRTNGSAAKALREELEQLQKNVQAARESYQTALTAKLQELQSASSEILNETFARFLRETELEAEDRINRGVAAMHRAGAGAR